MAKLILCYLFIFSVQPSKMQSSLEQLRQAYSSASTNTEICRKQLDLIKEIKNPTVLELAYSGAYHAMWAEHATSPLAKLNSFKKGRDELEQAIRDGKGNTEIHFLRLTIQYHAPAMVRYKQNIEEDLQNVLTNYDQVSSETLKKNIKKFLIQTDLLSNEQRKKMI
ncbi:hypothetical protein FAZ15_21680 [Sphingobacterium olei]|uniref:Uncharacterized protein n=1 Tax=Sphingobacterium olei TaxID=2571155 RepID=A0A4U0NAE2_9SPHI|nr:hypothetical protein [Sphingobacterium olei]TJZ50633.1 hypothetical protein FAZ15_21680 [Sphingobacterium olei]